MEEINEHWVPKNAWSFTIYVFLRVLKRKTIISITLFLHVDTVQPAYMERFGAAKTVPYIQKTHIREVHLYIYIYILGSIARET